MATAVTLLGVFLLAALWLGTRLRPRRRIAPAPRPGALSPVVRQHLHLYQGGQLDERQLEAAKAHFRDLLSRGELTPVEQALMPGPDFVVRVRALAELGGTDVADLLERQLALPLSADPLERAW